MSTHPTASVLGPLFARLTNTGQILFLQAAELARQERHLEVDIEHVLCALNDLEEGDAPVLLKHIGVNRGHLADRLRGALMDLERANRPLPHQEFSMLLKPLLERAWLEASIQLADTRIRTGHIVLALLSDPKLAKLTARLAPELGELSVDVLRQSFDEFTQGSNEVGKVKPAGPADQASASCDQSRHNEAGVLQQYTQNLTQRARDGKLDAVVGRDAEIRQMIDILSRRRQNNPILTGEPGVGKTAVVEGLALRVAAGDVPPSLQGVDVLTLDLALLQAGASMKGEFESRLRGVIEAVKASAVPIIVFIDEAHTLIGAGGQEGQNDAANLLKPALARGEMRTIAATTWSEYKKYFEKDAALARRFQVVKVEEPTEDKARQMLAGVVAAMQRHHGVVILQEGVDQAVRLSHRYISGRQLPDKAVSVLDTACAKVRMGQTATPADVEDARREIEALQHEIQALEDESSRGIDHTERLQGRRAALMDAQARLESVQARWQEQRVAVERFQSLNARLDSVSDGHARDALKSELAECRQHLSDLQADGPLVQAQVDGQAVAQVIEAWTGIPLAKMMGDEVNALLELQDRLSQRVIGQPYALASIAQRMQTAGAGIEDPSKPRGVFLLVGTSGVGKTETALALADELYGGERNVITINMSEYKESHSVSKLKGAPPGYVGYGQGGVLTEAVRRKPYSIVLLDEAEKAHPDVRELFFQVFDKGVLEDGEGRVIDFKNTIILLTSNAGTDTIMRACSQGDEPPSIEALNELIHGELTEIFKPAFLGRLSIIPYYPLRDSELKTIVSLKLQKIRRRLLERHQAKLNVSDEVVDEIVSRCQQADSGARNIDNVLASSMLPAISRTILQAMAEGRKISQVQVSVDNRELKYAIH
jgi:type VI secretion system protein VasG